MRLLDWWLTRIVIQERSSCRAPPGALLNGFSPIEPEALIKKSSIPCACTGASEFVFEKVVLEGFKRHGP